MAPAPCSLKESVLDFFTPPNGACKARPVEIWLILNFLGLEGGWGRAIVIECVHHLARTVVFFMPMNLGSQEGGNYAIFYALGYDKMGHDPLEIGVSISLIRRIREMVWAAVGWGVLMALSHGKFSKTAVGSESQAPLQEIVK